MSIKLLKATPPGGRTVLLVGTWEKPLIRHLKAQDDLGLVSVVEGSEAARLAHELRFDVCLSSLLMRPVDGFAVMRALLGADPDAVVVFSTHARDTATVVRAMREGAFDYVTEPHEDVAELTERLRFGANLRIVLRRGRDMAALIPSSTQFEGMIGRSERFLAVCREIRTVAATDSPVLLEGESGSGKELAARAIHSGGRRAGEPFIAVNCAALTGTLLASELFGCVKGAFTGADRDRKGLLAAADGGTIFLDEIGSTGEEFQAQLLRAMELGEVRPVGSTKTTKVDARPIVATNAPLEGLVERGRFRRDLYYRVNVMRIEMPPLRERSGDAGLLAVHFLNEFSGAAAKRIRGFSPQALMALETHGWPGNVRELRNAIERAVVYDTDGLIGAEDLPGSLGRSWVVVPGAVPPGLTLREATDEFTRRVVAQALTEAGRVKADAAKALGVSRTTLVGLMKRLGMKG